MDCTRACVQAHTAVVQAIARVKGIPGVGVCCAAGVNPGVWCDITCELSVNIMMSWFRQGRVCM